MNQFEFAQKGLHNVHIRFYVRGTEHTGVVCDDVFHRTGKAKRSGYTFIQSRNLRQHQVFQRAGDRSGMESLSSVVDVESIERAERIR